MIKNVVFDFGNVLVSFSPEYISEPFVNSPADKNLLAEVLFDRLYWDRLDEGTISDAETVSLAKKRLPERLHQAANDAYYNWVYRLPEIDGMFELVKTIKKKYGVKLFLLSNISEYFTRFKDNFPVLSEMDGCVFSALIGKVKPSAEIFEYLLHVCKVILLKFLTTSAFAFSPSMLLGDMYLHL